MEHLMKTPVGSLVLDLQERFDVRFSNGQFEKCYNRIIELGEAEFDRLRSMSPDQFKLEFPESR